MKHRMLKNGLWLVWMAVLVIPLSVAQEPGDQPEENQPPAQVEKSQPIKGGVSYEPILDENDGKLREPFKSPFQIEKERKDQRKNARALADADERLEFSVQELNLKGIYFQVEKGYFAIFEVGGETKWYQVGTKFEDGDLVNITDNEVWFKQYSELEEGTTGEGRIREIRRVLHQGE